MVMPPKELRQHLVQRLNVPADLGGKLTIRDMQRKDLPILLKYCEAHARFEQSPFDPEGKMERWEQFFFDPSLSIRCWMLEYLGQVIGYTTFMPQFSTWDAEYYLYLDCLYLDEGFRGGGLGAQVMQALNDYAQRHHYAAIQWQTPSFNQGAITFYQRQGAESKPKQRFVWKVS